MTKRKKSYGKLQLALTIITLAIVVLAAWGLLSGCAIIPPSHAVIIDDHYGNAKAINAKVQENPALPDYVKVWWAAEAKTWEYMSDWAHGRRPTPTSQPAKE